MTYQCRTLTIQARFHPRFEKSKLYTSIVDLLQSNYLADNSVSGPDSIEPIITLLQVFFRFNYIIVLLTQNTFGFPLTHRKNTDLGKSDMIW
ncbi:hypothetical protein DESC_760009 [Desulfosarcina cetonica]|nr:hypothetical protein DESC_760009 [Desulfosarcina cetonica]